MAGHISCKFSPADRYLYEFGLCSYANDWAQVDYAQNASDFGTWTIPNQLLILNYCEGNTILKEAASLDEFAAVLREVSSGRSLGLRPSPD